MADKSDDLKARLGLKKRRKKKEEEEEAARAQAEADAAAAKAAERANRDASIADARSRSAAADAAAGPAAEDFGFMRAEKTPVPERYDGPQYVVVEGSEEMAGQAKQRLLVIIGTAVVTFLIAFFMGQMSGAASTESETIDLYSKQAAAKLKGISEAQDSTGNAKILERIDGLKAQFEAVHSQIGAVLGQKGGASDGDWTRLQPKLEKVVAEMGRYKDDKVFIDPLSMTNELFTLGPVANFAVRTRQLYDKVSSAFSEAQSIAKVAAAAPDADKMVRLVVTEVSDREVTQQSWWKTGADGTRGKVTECKDAKDCTDGFTCKGKKCFAPRVPERKVSAVVKAVPDIGRQQVGTIDPKDPNSAPIYDWKMVLVLDEKDPETGKNKVQVASTKDVLQMNLSSAFTQMATKASVLVSRRLAEIILEAKLIADGVRWSKVETNLKACALNKKCTFQSK